MGAFIDLNRMMSIVVVALLAMLLTPVAAAAPSDPMMPQQCLEEQDPVNCLGQAAKCVVREQDRFLYECWGILGP